MLRTKIALLAGIVLVGSCTPANKFIVTNIGYEPAEVSKSIIYALPKTNLVTGIEYQKEVFLPGPYCDYALKMLGISGVNRSRQVTYKITGVTVDNSIEADRDHYYTLSTLEGKHSEEAIRRLEVNRYVLIDRLYSEQNIKQAITSELSMEGLHFTDVTMESNIELKKETIYKTILTDTSFIRVPVVTEQLEKKTIEKKAEEAAKLILEIRTDRYYLAAGMVDPYPQQFDLKTAIAELDHLEAEYLSLFIGKSYTQRFYTEFPVSPLGDKESENFILGYFSPSAGLLKSESPTSEALRIQLTAEGNTKSMRNLLPQHPEDEIYNKLYYRIPEMTQVKIVMGEMILHKERIPIFQYGAMVNVRQ